MSTIFLQENPHYDGINAPKPRIASNLEQDAISSPAFFQQTEDEICNWVAAADIVNDEPLAVKLHSTMDAMVWAEEYCRLNPGADLGMMVAWFANAIMVGYDHAKREIAGPVADWPFPKKQEPTAEQLAALKVEYLATEHEHQQETDAFWQLPLDFADTKEEIAAALDAMYESSFVQELEEMRDDIAAFEAQLRGTAIIEIKVVGDALVEVNTDAWVSTNYFPVGKVWLEPGKTYQCPKHGDEAVEFLYGMDDVFITAQTLKELLRDGKITIEQK